MPADLRALPKAVLHDHLDGGVRLDTVIELAAASGYELPSTDPDTLDDWFHQTESGSLERYLESFEHTIGVMQSAEALERVALEAVVDHAADGVVYAEIRFGPMLHTTEGLSPDDAVAAVCRGLAAGERETGVIARAICTALRTEDGSEQVAELAAAWRGRGVVGFDIAGVEAGYPADDHTAACRSAREAGVGLTVHAGEGDGPNSIWRALARCGAQRIGHGVRVIEDAVVTDGEITELGRLAAYVRDHRVPLEVSVVSNLDTAMYADETAHPLGALHRAGFVVTLNTDNRLMSRTSMLTEFELAARAHGFGAADFAAVTEAAIRAGFADWPTRRRLIEDVVRPAYRDLP